MKQIKIVDFPKYRAEFRYDEYNTWEESLKANGYPSATAKPDTLYGNVLELSDEEYTWFVLRWS